MDYILFCSLRSGDVSNNVEIKYDLAIEEHLKLSHAEQSLQPYQQQLRDFERLANKLGLWEKFINREKEKEGNNE